MVAVLAAVVALLLVVVGAGLYFYLNSQLHRSDRLVSFAGRPALGSGANWLIAGSEAAQGLSQAEEYKLSRLALWA